MLKQKLQESRKYAAFVRGLGHRYVILSVTVICTHAHIAFIKPNLMKKLIPDQNSVEYLLDYLGPKCDLETLPFKLD